MRKLAMQLGHDVQAEHRKSKVPLYLFIVFLAIGLGPLALEGGSICLSNWKEVMGVASSVRHSQPWTTCRLTSTSSKTCSGTGLPLSSAAYPGTPKMVLPAAAVVMAVAMLMLRR